MKYISTRGSDGPLSFEEALLNGLARDGGLYLPVEWPSFTKAEITAMRGKSYVEIAGLIMSHFTEGELTKEQLTQMADEAYCDFTHKDIAPLKSIESDIHILELFHGPTIAFKDYAMQFLSRVLQCSFCRYFTCFR